MAAILQSPGAPTQADFHAAISDRSDRWFSACLKITITPEPELLPNRIGIDTGAYDTGILTCLILENNTQSFLKTLPTTIATPVGGTPRGDS